MARVIEGWSLPNDEFKFRRNPPDGCGDMGVGGSGGEYLSCVCGRYSLRCDKTTSDPEWSNTWSTA